jgi:adenosylcobinamide kinase/adenosylcobinamide-phosphate guanylyltransferase
MGRLLFVTGGARSGKSRFAEDAAQAAAAPVVYLATMTPGDTELVERIASHRERRPAAWATVEEPLHLSRALGRVGPNATVLLDCVSLWVSNLFMRDAETPLGRVVEICLEAGELLLEEQSRRSGLMIAVSNEVGSGIVPEGALARYYRDALGIANARLARAADEAFLLVSGMALRLK